MEQQVCARCFFTIHRQLNVDGIKWLNKNLTSLAVLSHSTNSEQVDMCTVTQCACQHQQS